MIDFRWPASQQDPDLTKLEFDEWSEHPRLHRFTRVVFVNVDVVKDFRAFIELEATPGFIEVCFCVYGRVNIQYVGEFSYDC